MKNFIPKLFFVLCLKIINGNEDLPVRIYKEDISRLGDLCISESKENPIGRKEKNLHETEHVQTNDNAEDIFGFDKDTIENSQVNLNEYKNVYVKGYESSFVK